MTFNQAAGNNCQLYFNGDTAGNYSTASVLSTPSALSVTTFNNYFYMFASAGNTGTGYPQIAIIDIWDYTNTSIAKSAKFTTGGLNWSDTSRNNLEYGNGMWNGTSAISSIRVDSGTYTTGTTFALYGIV